MHKQNIWLVDKVSVGQKQPCIDQGRCCYRDCIWRGLLALNADERGKSFSLQTAYKPLWMRDVSKM